MKNQQIELKYPGKTPKTEILNSTVAAILQEKEVLGTPEKDGWVSKIFFGDNLPILKTLYEDPNIRGEITLVYIDPPFATQRVFDENDDLTKLSQKAYEDQLSGYDYLEFMRKRLVFLEKLLSKDGSIYVHLDQRMAFHMKVLMDEIFGSQNFRNWITRKKCHPKGFTRKTYGNIQDFILYYSKGKRPVWNRPLRKMTKEIIEGSEYRYVEEGTGRTYKKVPLHAPGVRHGSTGKPWRGKMPPKGKHWQYRPEKLEEFDGKGRIYWSPSGNPRLKVYLDERKGAMVQDIWLGFLDPMNQFTSVTGYPTEKNQELLERIIKTSSNEGDIVLDCFAGSGTTLAAAENLNRRWIGIDNSEVAIETMKRRLLGFQEKQEKLLPRKPFIVYHAVQRFQT